MLTKETATIPARWGAPVVSVLILLAFVVVLTLVLVRVVPTDNAQVVSVLLGTLTALVVQVGNYWLGSSAGSARKDATIAAAADQAVAVAVAAVDPVPAKEASA